MPFTSAVTKDATLNDDSSVSVVVVYSGPSEKDTEDTIILAPGSVLDVVTVQKEVRRRIDNRNAAKQIERSLKQIKNSPLDLTPVQDSADEKTLKDFAVLAGRMRDLERSQMRGCAQQDDYLAALTQMQEMYAAAKKSLQPIMDSVIF